MRQRFNTLSSRLLLIAALTMLLLGAFQFLAQPPPEPSTAAPIPPEKLGMVIRDPWYDFGTYPGQPDRPNYAAQDRMGELLAQMGVRWVRLEFHIAGSDAYSLTHVMLNDYFIHEVAPRHDFKILGVLNYQLNRGRSPHELSSPITTVDPLYGSGVNDYMRTWLNRARLIVNRYGESIAAYEVLNEPNRLGEASHDAIPAMIVARLQTRFYTLFRHDDSHAPGNQAWRDNVQIILGGLQPAGRGEAGDYGYLSDRDYLRQIYESDDFQRYYAQYERFPLDGLGYHPYPMEIRKNLTEHEQARLLPTLTSQRAPPHLEAASQHAHDIALIHLHLDRVRAVLAEVGDPQVPFWITEIGYNAGYLHHDEYGQADFLQAVYQGLAPREDVARVFWFKYEDFPPASGPHVQQWGGVVIPFVEDASCPGSACYDVEGRPAYLRPSFWTYRELAGRGDALPEPPAQVTLSGPLTGTLHTRYTFTASISRTTATEPVRYTWQASMHEKSIRESGLQDRMEFAWSVPGTHTVALEAQNIAGSVINRHTISIAAPTPTITPTPLPSPTPTITPTRTFTP